MLRALQGEGRQRADRGARIGTDGYSRLSEIARSGLTRDATYLGQTMAPWQRKLTISPSAASKEYSRHEYRPARSRRV
jgi:hypothetical protein